MRLLLDSHSLVWFVDQDHLLSTPARSAMADPANDLLLSAASIWEIAIKVGLGKLALTTPYRDWMTKAVTDLGLTLLPITVEVAAVQALLPWHHRDPFDRVLVAHAVLEKVGIVSADKALDPYGVKRVW